MATPRVLLILGAGPRIGSAVASKFASLGYSIALASRKGTNTTTPESYLSLRADFTSTACMPALFAAVKSTFHTAPSVIVYNAGSLHTPPDARSVLSIPVEDVVTDLIVNTVSVYAAAQEAIRGWETLGADAKKSFIYTGNILNVAIMPVPMLLDVGMGKAASAYWLGVADGAYKDRGAR
jgi:NAD(P)-dependent dehydrogenase (short-subunit alcohol dehydrogenase family)